MKIAIIDYNAGNVASVANALRRFGFEYVITRDPDGILTADKVIFPGQGRAGSAMRNLREAGLDAVIPKITKPFLGICLGMQLLFDSSEEDNTQCLGVIKGKIKKFSESGIKIPQIGWNVVVTRSYDPLFRNVLDTFYAYFVNSYYAESDAVLGSTQYGDTFVPAVVKKDNFYGIQFHPEKSGEAGLRILKNFCELDATMPNETLVIPAIDIICGKCVRLQQGNYDEQTTYSEDPLAVAKTFIESGAKYLHLVDLDGAKEGTPRNFETIAQLVKVVDVPIQVGGGIRTFEEAKQYLDLGVERVIVSTSALENPEMLKKVIEEYGPGRIIVSVDVKDDMVATRGWQELSRESVDDFLAKLSALGITTIIYTDVQRDGTLWGPNYESIRTILKKPFHIIIAGGVGNLEDIRTLNEIGAYGVVVGKALYEKKVDLKETLRVIPSLEIAQVNVKPARFPTKRIIPCMDIANGRVVKGVNFTNLKDAGDPAELGKRYSEERADELVFLDVTATVEERKTLYELVERIAKSVSVPFAVGGGVSSVEDIKRLLDAGADKVSIGSAAVTNPSLVNKAAEEFGSQCIVISVDPKRRGDGTWAIYVKGGREEMIGVDAIEFCKDMERRGAGELLVNSLDKDGTRSGYDLELLRKISEAVNIPIIASSGAGSKEDFLKALTDGKAEAALAASLFHSGELSISEVKTFLAEQGLLIRV